MAVRRVWVWPGGRAGATPPFAFGKERGTRFGGATDGVEVGLGKEGLQALAEGVGGGEVCADDEDGVVAGYGAEDFGPFFVIDAGGDGMGCTTPSQEHQEVSGLTKLDAEAGEHVGDGREVVRDGGCAVAFREGVASGSLEQAHFADVAGEGGLGGLDAPLGEFAAELVLVGDCGAYQQIADRGLALSFHGRRVRRGMAPEDA